MLRGNQSMTYVVMTLNDFQQFGDSRRLLCNIKKASADENVIF